MPPMIELTDFPPAVTTKSSSQDEGTASQKASLFLDDVCCFSFALRRNLTLLSDWTHVYYKRYIRKLYPPLNLFPN